MPPMSIYPSILLVWQFPLIFLSSLPSQHLWQNCAEQLRRTSASFAPGTWCQSTATPSSTGRQCAGAQWCLVHSGFDIAGERRGHYVWFCGQRLWSHVTRDSCRHAGLCAAQDRAEGGTQTGSGLMATLLAADLGQLPCLFSAQVVQGQRTRRLQARTVQGLSPGWVVCPCQWQYQAQEHLWAIPPHSGHRLQVSHRQSTDDASLDKCHLQVGNDACAKATAGQSDVLRVSHQQDTPTAPPPPPRPPPALWTSSAVTRY